MINNFFSSLLLVCNKDFTIEFSVVVYITHALKLRIKGTNNFSNIVVQSRPNMNLQDQ